MDLENPRTKLSVIIPAYNAAGTLEKCLRSLAAQTYRPHEIIVVDDGSADGTAEIASKFATVMKNTRGKGAGGARNTGAKAASGDVLVFTDSDCVPPADWLERICRAFENGPDVGAVTGGYVWHEGKTFIGNFAFIELTRRRRQTTGYVETTPSNNIAVRAEIFRKVGGFPETFSGATNEDVVFSYRISRVSKILWLHDNGIGHHFHETLRGYFRQQYAFARDTVVMYRQHPEIMSAKTHQGRLIYIEALLVGLTLCALLRPWPWFFLGLSLIWILNLPLIYDCFRAGGIKMAAQCAVFLPFRDLNWIRGVLGGIIKTMRCPKCPT